MTKSKHKPKKRYTDISQFNLKTATHTGGVTGSKKVIGQDSQDYQLKPSIKDNKFLRRAKARDTDRENFGEFLSSAVGKSLIPNSDGFEFTPEVSLVYDRKKKQCLVASRYLKNVQGTLDDYAKKHGAKAKGKENFVTITSDSKAPSKDSFDVTGDDKKLLRQDLTKSIALSALSGDHDINPGNMLVVTDTKGQDRIVRIDFGHAFNDLLNAPKVFGGQVRNSNNRILDFFNRGNVAHVDPSRRISKLWASYEGIVPSQDMVDALKEISGSGKYKEGLKIAKQSFKDLIIDLETNSDSKSKALLAHIVKSLAEINNNIATNKSKEINSLKIVDPHKVLDKTFETLDTFYKDGQKQTIDTAKLMQLQIDIDRMILSQKKGQDLDATLTQDIKDRYQELTKIPGIGRKYNQGLMWVKSNRYNKAFKGTLDEFISERSKNLGLATSQNKNLQVIFKVSKDSPLQKTLGMVKSKLSRFKIKAVKGKKYINALSSRRAIQSKTYKSREK